jgi:translation initiation factor 1 (eIF-1/SUI1)
MTTIKATSASTSKDSYDSDELLDEFERDAELLSSSDRSSDSKDTDYDVDSGDGEINISTINTVSGQLDTTSRRVDVWLTNKGRRKITAIEGITSYPDFDTDEKLKPMMTHFKKSGCAASIIKQKRNAKAKINFVNKHAKVMTLTGDHVAEVKEYLLKACKIDPKEIHFHM